MAYRRPSSPLPLWVRALRGIWRVPVLRWPLLILGTATLVIELHDADWLFPPAIPYQRSLYRHWIDSDHNCRDTRTEVLIRDSRIAPKLSPDGCKVVGGEWRDVYTGRTVRDPRQLDIDHRVPLAEAHRSGGDHWSAARRQAFANDLGDKRTLVAVSSSANRSKSDGDPVDWMPPDWTDWCDYVEAWIAVKAKWGLRRDVVERLWTDVVAGICRRL